MGEMENEGVRVGIEGKDFRGWKKGENTRKGRRGCEKEEGAEGRRKKRRGCKVG